MFKEYLETYKIAVVIIGQFNPAILHPFWLANKELIRVSEAENANVGVVHSEFSKFALDWVRFDITPNKFEITCDQEPYFEPLKDLIIEIFKILKETPIESFGINHLMYYDLRDRERHYNFGNKLAPLSNWSDFLNDPRLSVINITERKRKDGLDGQINIRIQEPDIKVSSGFGVLVNINDHLVCEKQKFTALFSDNWYTSSQRAESISQKMWEKINN